MGKWATLNGRVVVHKDKHLSLNKLVDDFLQGEDYSLEVYKPSVQNEVAYKDYTYNLKVVCESEGYLAWKMFSDFRDILVEKGCKCDLRAGIDLWRLNVVNVKHC